MPDWNQFAELQLVKVANVAPVDNGALEGGIPDEGTVWADHAALVKGTGIWIFFNRPALEPGDQLPSEETIERQKSALRLLFEKCGLTELGHADGDEGRFTIIVRAPIGTKTGRMTSISNLAKQIGCGLAADQFYGAIARGYADDIGLMLDVLLQELNGPNEGE